MTTSVRTLGSIRLIQRAPHVIAAPTTPSAKAGLPPSPKKPPVWRGGYWLDDQRDAYHGLLHAVCEEQRRLKSRYLRMSVGDSFQINVDRKFPREIWTMLLWDGDDSYWQHQNALIQNTTVMLRKVEDAQSGEERLDVISGPSNRCITSVSAEAFFSHDRAREMVLSWLLEVSGVKTGLIKALVAQQLQQP